MLNHWTARVIFERVLEALLILALSAFITLLAFGGSPARGESFKVADLPLCEDGSPLVAIVVDGASSSDCSTGSGTTEVLCGCLDGSWGAVGGGGSGDITDVWSCSSGNCNALTAASGDTLDAGSADSAKPATRSTSLPGTCAEGDLHQDTDSGDSELYICTATNTWKKLAASDQIFNNGEYSPLRKATGTGVVESEEWVDGTEGISWTAMGAGTHVTKSDAGFDMYKITYTNTGGATHSVEGWAVAVPSLADGESFLYTVHMPTAGLYDSTWFPGLLLIIGNASTATNIESFGPVGVGNGPTFTYGFAWKRFTSYTSSFTSVSASAGVSSMQSHQAEFFAGLVERSGSTYTLSWWVSQDGILFQQFSTNRTLPNPPDYIGIGGENFNNSEEYVAVYNFFRIFTNNSGRFSRDTTSAHPQFWVIGGAF